MKKSSLITSPTEIRCDRRFVELVQDHVPHWLLLAVHQVHLPEPRKRLFDRQRVAYRWHVVPRNLTTCSLKFLPQMARCPLCVAD